MHGGEPTLQHSHFAIPPPPAASRHSAASSRLPIGKMPSGAGSRHESEKALAMRVFLRPSETRRRHGEGAVFRDVQFYSQPVVQNNLFLDIVVNIFSICAAFWQTQCYFDFSFALESFVSDESRHPLENANMSDIPDGFPSILFASCSNCFVLQNLVHHHTRYADILMIAANQTSVA